MDFNEYYEKLVTLNLKKPSNKKSFFVMGSEDYLTNIAFVNSGILDQSPFIIPSDEDNKLNLFNIEKQTRKDVEEIFGINTELDWQCNTIANVIFENILQRLFLIMYDTKCKALDLNFYNLFSIYLSTKKNKDAEKEGNINIFFKNNETFNNIISNTQIDKNIPKSILDFQYSKYSDLYKLIDINSQIELNLRHGIIISDNWISIAITYMFIRNIYDNIVRKIMIDGNKSIFINFNDNIEFYSMLNKGEMISSMRPGMNAKLLVKSDEITEADND